MTDVTDVYGPVYASRYDEVWMDGKLEDDLASLAPWLDRLDGSARLLDVGCGTGNHCAALAARGWRVEGLDQSTHMLDQARPKVGAEVRLVHGRMCDSGLFPPSRFALIYSFFCPVNYLRSPAELHTAMHNFATWLRPGGWLCLELKVGGDELDLGGGSRRQGSLVHGGRWRFEGPSRAWFVERLEEDGRELASHQHELTLFSKETLDEVARANGFVPARAVVDPAGGESFFVWRRPDRAKQRPRWGSIRRMLGRHGPPA